MALISLNDNPMYQNNEQGVDYNLGRLGHSFSSGLAFWNKETLNSGLSEKVKKTQGKLPNVLEDDHMTQKEADSVG